MTIQILQHSAGTPPGSVLAWAKDRGHAPIVHRLDLGAELPKLHEKDAVVILGGPMSVHDLAIHPWLKHEKEFIAAAIRQGQICIGLCLGGQLLAESLGGKVQNSGSWEVGWHTVNFITPEMPSQLTVFEWHQDCFSLPPGATLLASNEFSAAQAFRYKNHVLGFQFHPESDENFVRDCATDEEYPTGCHVQSPDEVIKGLRHLAAMRDWFFKTLDELVANAR